MPELLKNMYNQETLSKLAVDIQSVYESFSISAFLQSTIDGSWETLELKERVRKISTNLGKFLPSDYSESLQILYKIVANCPVGFWSIIFPDFVEVYGQDELYWDISMKALEKFTSYSSSEFAVRPFILKDEKRMMAQMYAWSKHENEHVRRLSSEGCRPALPWGQALNKYKKDPSPVILILEQLKADPSLYVRKSVANNLNDISKTHPNLIATLANDWYSKNEYTDWIIKRGCRTLLKRGNRDILDIFGYCDGNLIEVEDFIINETYIRIGNDITFSFTVQTKDSAKIRLEYGIDYVKANGKRNQKIFQISDISLKGHEKRSYIKKHSFANLSTRKHYPGIHSIALIINGIEKGKLDFRLI
jgi:3-methyladenine DNA glycosylase AlkC